MVNTTAAKPKTRITKDPDVRREELLDVALRLCRSDGYDQLRVERIVQEAGVAKGTFYHYFASKDAVLEALVARFGDDLFDHLSPAAVIDAPAAERLRAVMEAAQGFKLTHGEVLLASLLFQDENLAMRQRIYRVWRQRTREVLTPLIRDGVADGSFNVISPVGAVDILVLLWFDAADQLWERGVAATTSQEFTAVMLDGAAAIAQAEERVLGVPAGTYAVPTGPEVTAMLTDLFNTLDRKQK